MTHDELTPIIAMLQGMFDLVRVVDVSLTKEIVFKKGVKPCEKNYVCYAAWNKTGRCANCVSAKALSCKNKVTKFEFVDNEIYFVISKYIEIEGKPYVIEMVTKTSDETLWDAAGKNEFIDTISTHTKKIYSDSLTNVYNRRYYDEQICVLSKHPGVALVDVDNFKQINDTYGHTTGDQVLKAITFEMVSNVRSSDIIIRYGGDEFLMVMQNIPKEIFFKKMETIRQRVNNISIQNLPEIKLSVSIGAFYNQEKTVAEMVEYADKLLYKAKETRNAVITSP